MIFQTEGAIDKIVRGEKTQTRRIVKPHHVCWADGWYGNGPIDITDVRVVVDKPYRTTKVYVVGKDYAVQSGRGKPGVMWYPPDSIFNWATPDTPLPNRLDWTPLRIRITAIRQEDVRKITEDDARAEGYDCLEGFFVQWTRMHDKTFWILHSAFADGYDWFDDSLNAWARVTDHKYHDAMFTRPAERYMAWSLTFEVVR